MNTSTSLTLMAMLLPLLAVLGSVILLPSLVHASMRLHATRSTLGTALLTLLTGGYALQHVPAMTPEAEGMLLAVATFAATLIAAPLLDRGRNLGTVIAAGAGGLGSVAAAAIALDHHPTLPVAALLPIALLVAVLVGFAGSALVPMSPLRHQANGALRGIPENANARLAGWAMLCAALVVAARFLDPALPLLPVLACATAAGLLALFTSRADLAVATLGEALAAGVLLALTAHVSAQTAIYFAPLAACSAVRGPAIAQSLRLDDPLHATGSVLLPLALGLLLPGLIDFSAAALAGELRLLGLILAAAALISVILWPLTMIFVGLALPAPLARQGARP